MHSPLSSALLLAGALLLVAAPAALADDPGAGISVEPAEVTAGRTVLLAGNSLEPEDERVLVLQGESLTLSLGTATTDADGMLSEEITIPGHVPSGTYQFQAIGDEALQVELRVTAMDGAAEPAPDEATIGTRDRRALEQGLIVVAAVVIGALGLVLIVRADRRHGASPA